MAKSISRVNRKPRKTGKRKVSEFQHNLEDIRRVKVKLLELLKNTEVLADYENLMVEYRNVCELEEDKVIKLKSELMKR